MRGKGTKIKKKKGRKAIIVDEIDPSKFTSDFYFFLFGIPLAIPETKAGVFMAQSYKNYGYKEIFEEAFKKFVSIKLGESITGEISILTNPVLFKRTLKESGFKSLDIESIHFLNILIMSLIIKLITIKIVNIMILN